MAEKPAIVFSNVTKSFTLKHNESFKEFFIAFFKREKLSSEFKAVDDLTLQVPAGQSVALMGRNGSGKSTTLKLLSGVMLPDSGWVRTRGRIAGLIEVTAGFNPNLTGRDNVFLNAAILGMTKKETEQRFQDILDFSEIGEFIDTEVKHYSSGMRARLAFAVAVHTELDVLLVDEVLSVGDAAFRKKCAERMQELRAQGKTMFVVSHSSSQVKELCERGVVLDKGRVVFDGPINEAVKFITPPVVKGHKFEIVGPIREFYDRNPSAYGKPLGPETIISENGGGLMQEFSKGIITHSFAADPSNATFGQGKSMLLTAYRQAGGPAGEWGFIAGPPFGSLKDDGARSRAFQFGVVEVTIKNGLRFIPNVITPAI
ncbi:ATP-binding cassette domain-containing protein [Leucobacter salsicius]|uniref:ATP-binding cassette domain-containing protein n=1 Tax=Leucobacter salsicius TaxID=664638 RepID=UPI000346697F